MQMEGETPESTPKHKGWFAEVNHPSAIVRSLSRTMLNFMV